uniref:Acyl_transf_3 domain-containing protein n=1 Tax=Caenorhabditis tropicalis TaxID=1561998 RepID=A0A1I7TMS5_9PELO
MVFSYVTSFGMGFYLYHTFFSYFWCGKPTKSKFITWEIFPFLSMFPLFVISMTRKQPEHSPFVTSCKFGLIQTAFIGNILNILYLNTDWIDPHLPRYFCFSFIVFGQLRRSNAGSILIPKYPFKVNWKEVFCAFVFFSIVGYWMVFEVITVRSDLFLSSDI